MGSGQASRRKKDKERYLEKKSKPKKKKKLDASIKNEKI